jgi:serine protease Do
LISISVQTCEDRAAGEPACPFRPEGDQTPALFARQDPFGARKAVVPLFWMDADGDLQGMGTAFSLDPWGGFITADHVIAGIRAGARCSPNGDGNFRVKAPSDAGFVAVLGYGVVFGTVGLPQEAIAPIIGAWTPGIEGNDPLATLHGRHDFQPLDLAILRALPLQPGWIHCLPMRSRPPRPKVGDTVIALGFPQIDTFRGPQEDARTIIEEGMFAAYGRVTALLPDGRDRSTPTPVFEVEANWPSGMSGGPVLNSAGEVVGIVSRSLEPEPGADFGVGWATWLEALPFLAEAVPTLDDSNADRRRGWAVVQDFPWTLAGVYATEAEADERLSAAGGGFAKRFGLWRMGSDDFVRG